MGKPISDSPGRSDVNSTAANCIAWYAEADRQDLRRSGADLATTHSRSSRASRSAWWRAIVPWNFPRSSWRPGRSGPRSPTGNSFILKPSEKVAVSRRSGSRSSRCAGGHSGWRASTSLPGFGNDRRPGARAAHGRGLHRLHRFHTHRQAACCSTPAKSNHETGVARVRRQVARTSSSRTCPDRRSRGGGRGFRHFLQPGRDVFRGLATRRPRVREGRHAREDRRDRPDDGTRRPARPQVAPRRDRRPGAAQHRDGLHRVREEEGADVRLAASGRARTAAASSSSRRYSRT